eukprot:1160391-Pelagomonas_calceolata.AAC.3
MRRHSLAIVRKLSVGSNAQLACGNEPDLNALTKAQAYHKSEIRHEQKSSRRGYQVEFVHGGEKAGRSGKFSKALPSCSLRP